MGGLALALVSHRRGTAERRSSHVARPNGALMTDAIARAGAWMAYHGATLPDTVFTRRVASGGLLEEVAGIASGLIAILLLVLTVVCVPAAWNFRKSYKKVSDLLDRIYGDVTPFMRHASSIAENVDYVAVSIRADVQRVNATIASANQRLEDAMATTEARLQEFNALLSVVQSEAEQVFVATAAAVRGVRTGAAALRGDAAERNGPRADGMEFAMDDTDGLANDEGGATDDEERYDGNDGNTEPAPHRPARPHVRSGARRRG
jgi:uncharacterized protein YoxC